MKKIINLLFVVIMLFSIINVSTLAASIATPKVKATNTLSGVSVTWNKVSGASKYVVYKRLGTSSTWDIISTTTGTSYEDKGTLTAGKYYVYSVKAYNSAGNPSDYIKANCATVQRVIAPYTKASNALDGINVTWGKVAGANKYVVLRRIGTESTWKTLCTTTGTSFVDKNVKAGIYYIYSIRAVNGTGYSAYDVNKRITVQRVVAPYTKATNAINGINVTWGKVTGATKYVVLRRIGTESTWKTLCTTTGTSFLDKNVTPGIYYIYSIRAVNGTGYSAYDINKRITVQRVVAPVTRAINAIEGISVEWAKVDGASKYIVFRRMETESTWKTLCTTTDNSFLDKNVKAGINYTYSVRAVNGTGYSAYDSGKCMTAHRILSPAVKAVNKSNGVELSWNTIETATRYVIFRREGGSSDWTYVGFVREKTSYLDTTVVAGKYYVYSVRANGENGLSAYDGSKCATIKALNGNSDVYESYKKVLDSYPVYSNGLTIPDEYSETNYYTLYDIDKNGTPELIVREEHNDFYVYTYSNGEAKYSGSLWSVYGTPLYECNGNGVAVHWGGMGNLRVEYFTLYSLNNGVLSEGENIISTEENSFDELYATLDRYTPIDNFCIVNNYSLLAEECN